MYEILVGNLLIPTYIFNILYTYFYRLRYKIIYSKITYVYTSSSSDMVECFLGLVSAKKKFYSKFNSKNQVSLTQSPE